MTQFFETQMGRKFYDCDVPKAVRALERIADALEALRRSQESERQGSGAKDKIREKELIKKIQDEGVLTTSIRMG
jgi:hypothetical protein